MLHGMGMSERERAACEKSMSPEVSMRTTEKSMASEARPRTPSDADVSVAPFDEMSVSVVRFQGKGGSIRRTSTRVKTVGNVLTEAAVRDDGTPPVEIDAAKLLGDVVWLLDSSMAGCTAAFATFYRKYTISEEARKLLIDSFWYVSVCLFDQTHTKAAAALLKRLSRTYSVFMYGMPPGRDKDMFLQYFPYIIVQGIESAYRLYFPSSGSLYTPAFFDRVHALVSTLFVHDTGGGHGRGLRDAMRDKLFNPKNGRGPLPPPLPDMGDSTHRLATDWSDIVCDDLTGQYHVVAERGGGKGAPSPTTLGSLNGDIRAGTAPENAKRSNRKGNNSRSRSRSSKRGGGTAPGNLGSESTNCSSGMVQWHFPGADELVKDPSRPNSAEFELSNYNGQSQRSPLVGSYLRGVETPESSAVPQQFLIKRNQDVDNNKQGSQALFKSTLRATADVRPPSSDGLAGQRLGLGSALRHTTDSGKLAKVRKEQNDAHVLGLAESLGLEKEARSALGAGEKSEQSYKHVKRLHAEAVRESVCFIRSCMLSSATANVLEVFLSLIVALRFGRSSVQNEFSSVRQSSGQNRSCSVDAKRSKNFAGIFRCSVKRCGEDSRPYHDHRVTCFLLDSQLRIGLLSAP